MTRVEGSDEAYLAALGLAWLTASGGDAILRLLKDRGPAALWRASAHALERWGLRAAAAAAFVERRKHFDIDRARESLSQAGLCFVPYDSEEFPAELRQLSNPPAGLFLYASDSTWRSVLGLPRIAIVGTRRITSYGARVTEQFATNFAQRGVVVVSGMALGVDGLAHRSALEAGGLSVAVLGCGPDVIYPSRNRSLYQKMRLAGVIVSEFPPGSSATPWNFPRRNRIMAALGDAVLVTEASLSSGALQTVSWALELGRPVFSVPGPISVDGYQGCNSLLYDGAFPAIDPGKTVEDFFEQTRMARVGREAPVSLKPSVVSADSICTDSPETSGTASEEILRALSLGPCTVDNLLTTTGLGVRELTMILARMELEGIIARAGPGMYIRRG